MKVAGFSVNLLTLFALVLVIGTVVDDSIVVVEAVKAKLDEGRTSTHKASEDAMNGLSVTLFTTRFMEKLSERPEIGEIYSSYDVNYPQYRVDLDVARCKKMGGRTLYCPQRDGCLLGRRLHFQLQQVQQGLSSGFAAPPLRP
jgi:multidrug efflux pump subunit AcrB